MTSIKTVPYTEKYRPETLDEVVGNEQSVETMKNFLDRDDVPHLLLHGPAGTGKTASVVSFAKDRFGDEFRQNLIKFNASDERGIDVVRDQIADYAEESPSGNYSYKILYLDEVDSMTDDAQNALRRTMEKYSDQTRFFLSCNWVNELIDPIQSRCTPLSFSRLEDEEIREIVMNVIEGEGLEYEEEAVESIVGSVYGDARRAVGSLQATQVNGDNENITVDSLLLTRVGPDREKLEKVLELSINGQTAKAMDMSTKSVIPKVTDFGLLCKEMIRILRSNENISRDVRFYMISQVGNLESNIINGCNPEVQVNSFLANLPVIENSSISNYE